MVLDVKILELYEKIKFYDRYKTICENNRFEDDLLEKQDKREVLKLFQNFGYESKYIAKESFYKISTELNGYKFYFHIGLKYGIIEIIFGSLSKTEDSRLGGVCSRICKLIKRSKGENPDPIKPPNFTNYEQLSEILKESLSLYEDFKKAVLELQP